MKKIFIFLGLMFVMLSSTYAQKGRQAIGFGLSYGTEIEVLDWELNTSTISLILSVLNLHSIIFLRMTM